MKWYGPMSMSVISSKNTNIEFSSLIRPIKSQIDLNFCVYQSVCLSGFT